MSVETIVVPTAVAAPPRPRARAAAATGRVAVLLTGLALFVTALGLMKTGASGLVPALHGSAFTDSPVSALGLGWLGACVVLSGSPVAASSLTLLDGGAIDRGQAFAMLTGSRLGASFVVLVAGFVYALRRRGGQRAPLSIGIVSLTVTAVAYVPGALLGGLLLGRGHLDGVNLTASPGLVSVTDAAFGWTADVLQRVAPDWTLFPLGVLTLLVAFRLFDRVLPQVGSEALASHGAWLRRPWPMFALGCLVALLTLSVSVALTVLVPLVARGYLDRDDALPYIAGANITTLGDTLVAAIVLGNADATRVVLAEILGVGLWTVVLIGLLFPALRRTALGTADAVLASRRRLTVYVAALVAVPILLVAL